MLELKLDLTVSQEEYCSAAPFPHCIMDGIWPDEFLNEMIREWPDAENDCWLEPGGADTNRFRNPNPSTFPPYTQKAFAYLGSSEFKYQLERLTGLSGLFLDPDCDMLEGMHLNCPGSGLGLHQDGLWNERVQGYRVVNLFIYLNPEWQDGNGGELSLFDISTKESVVSIPPLFNRTVIVAVNEDALHYLRPVNNMQRKSLTVYYYVKNSPGPKNTKEGIRWYSFDDLSWVHGEGWVGGGDGTRTRA